MNKIQKVVICIGCAIALLAVLFPPVFVVLPGETVPAGGFQFEWVGDMNPRYQIHIGSLLVRLFVVVGITSALTFVTKSTKA